MKRQILIYTNTYITQVNIPSNIQDENSAEELFARKRVNYQMTCKHLDTSNNEWSTGITALAQRHGCRIDSLSLLEDFKLFRLTQNPVAM